MIRLSAINRRLRSSRRTQRMAAASWALALAAGYAGKPLPAKAASPNSRGTVEAPRGLLASEAQHVGTFTIPGGRSLKLQGVKVRSKIQDGSLVVSGLSGSVAGGRISATGHVNTGDKSGQQNINAQFDDIDLRELLGLLGIDGITGSMSIVKTDGIVNLKWQGLDPQAVRQTITGAATIKTGPGSLSESSPMLKRVASSAGIKNLDQLAFSSGRIDTVANNGVVEIRSLVLHGQQFQLNASGTVNLREQTLNLQMDVDVTPEIAKRSKYYRLQSIAGLFGGGKTETNKQGLVEVPRIVFAGSMNDPKVSMDRGARTTAAVAPSPDVPIKAVASVPPDSVTPTVEAVRAAQPDSGPKEVVRQDDSAEKKKTPFWRSMFR